MDILAVLIKKYRTFGVDLYIFEKEFNYHY
jgi:hypothetical protein